jgi:hypothetical protein
VTACAQSGRPACSRALTVNESDILSKFSGIRSTREEGIVATTRFLCSGFKFLFLALSWAKGFNIRLQIPVEKSAPLLHGWAHF